MASFFLLSLLTTTTRAPHGKWQFSITPSFNSRRHSLSINVLPSMLLQRDFEIIGRQSDDKFLNSSTGEMLSVVYPQTVDDGLSPP